MHFSPRKAQQGINKSPFLDHFLFWYKNRSGMQNGFFLKSVWLKLTPEGI